MMQNKPKIALTGGYASGKSTVLMRFFEKGFSTISADLVYHDLLKDEACVKQISQLVGVSPKLVDGRITLDKQAVSSKVFNDEKCLLKLNNFTHNLIYDKMFEIFQTTKNDHIIFEIPLLFESDKQNEFDCIIVVKRKIENRLESGAVRDKIDKQAALSRIKNQINYDNMVDNTHTYIYNDGSLEQLYAEVDKVIDSIEEKYFK